ncbi:hypothetical protein ACNPQM_37695 [Streptomyces sp. NPDC056231]|uniref:hypothetical protein n=1 Tax=Streptomyces sp. NPDC056231 TaxID=3345755 RepID=UPI003AAFC2F5
MQLPQDDDTADLLAPVPAVRTGGLVGYARVSTKGPLLDRQIHALTEAGCIRIFADKKSRELGAQRSVPADPQRRSAKGLVAELVHGGTGILAVDLDSDGETSPFLRRVQ